MSLPKYAVIRVNMAWFKTIDQLEIVLKKNKSRVIFLDYPKGRSKPPKPTININKAFVLLEKYRNIKYFAVSNIETASEVQEIMKYIPKHIEFIPKIETRYGINQLTGIVKSCGIKKLQLDKEDLYSDLQFDNAKFFKYVDRVRSICKDLKVTLLELEGVVFSKRK